MTTVKAIDLLDETLYILYFLLSYYLFAAILSELTYYNCANVFISSSHLPCQIRCSTQRENVWNNTNLRLDILLTSSVKA